MPSTLYPMPGEIIAFPVIWSRSDPDIYKQSAIGIGWEFNQYKLSQIQNYTVLSAKYIKIITLTSCINSDISWKDVFWLEYKNVSVWKTWHTAVQTLRYFLKNFMLLDPGVLDASYVKHHSFPVSSVTVICDVLTRWKLLACISVCLLFKVFKGKILCQDLRLTPIPWTMQHITSTI